MRETHSLIGVVEDDASVNEVICEFLRDEGYTVQGCLGVAEANRILASTRPVLIITDLWMEKPDSGWQFIQQLRDMPEYADLPLILCAANQAFLRERARELEALKCGVVEKPFNVDDLLHTVERRIGSARGVSA
jgi:CheY-like chemotaxis protein